MSEKIGLSRGVAFRTGRQCRRPSGTNASICPALWRQDPIERRLAGIFVADRANEDTLLYLAFHTVCDLVAKLWRETRDAIGTRRRFFEELGTITKY